MLLFLATFFSCVGQKDDGKTYNENYKIAKIPGISNFYKLSKHEKEIDSIFISHNKKIDSLFTIDEKLKENSSIAKSDFSRNRGRIYLTSFENGKLANIDKEFSKGMPTSCECSIKQDTILVRMSIGFFGGMSFTIKVADYSFQSIHYLYVSGAKPFKANMIDTFTNQLFIDSKFQHLILDKKPLFVTGEHITGFLTTTSKKYYLNTYGNKLDEAYTVAKIYFTCITKIN